MKQFYYRIYSILSICLSCILPSFGQFSQSSFQFESAIVDIIQVENQRFVATATNGLYVSEDKGQTWLRRWLPREVDPKAWDGYRSITILSIAFIDNRLWAMTDLGMYVSDDRGVTWRRIYNPNEYVSPDSPSHTSAYYKIASHAGSLYVTEKFFDSKQATYGYRLLKSDDRGEHWFIAPSPAFTSFQLTATEQALFVVTKSTVGAVAYISLDQAKSWQPLTSSIPFEGINALTVDGASIIITGYRNIKDLWGSIMPNMILTTSSDMGQSWKTKEFPAINYESYNPKAAVIHRQKFVVAMTNQIAYSAGDGRWEFDSLGLKSPNAFPEGGMIVINDTLWVGYQDMRFRSDQFALKGYLLSRPINELSTSYLSAPSLLRADSRYRETVILDWQRANVLNDQYYYNVERAEGSPENFQSIAHVSVSASSFIDEQTPHGKLYYYRVRTEHSYSSYRSKYSSVVSVAKANLCIRAAYLSYFEDLQMPSTDTLFARSGSEIIRSTDGGRSWGLLTPCFFFNQRYSPSYGKYISISFPTSQIGYAMVGDGSFLSNKNMLLKTVDGGETWALQPIRQNLDIYRILFVSESVGFALVSNASGAYLLYKTTNGGRDFSAVPGAPGFLTLQLKNGLLVGHDNKARVSFSSDQALTWSNTNRYSSSAYIFDAKRYVIGYSGGDSTYVRLTADGGKTWQSATINLKRYDQIHDIQFLDNQRGFLIGGYTNEAAYDIDHLFSLVYQTTDGGLTWTPVKQPGGTQGEASEIVIKKNKIYILYRPTRVQPVAMLGSIHMSDDAGKTWQVINDIHGKKDFLYQSISYRNEKEGIAITKSANNATLTEQYFTYYTKDGGFTWLQASSTASDDTWFVRFINAETGFRVGNNVVYYTLDGSKNWQKVAINQFPITNPSFRQIRSNTPFNTGLSLGSTIQFLSALTWIALSDDNRMFITKDHGQTWQVMNTPILRNPMFYFVNPSIGYVTVENKASGDQLWKTKDSGLTWTLVGPFSERSLFFLTETIGFAGLKRTTDGGKHWLIQKDLIRPEKAADVWPNYRFIDEQTGYVGPSFYTTDGGAHWATLTYLSEDFNKPYLSFIGPTVNESYGTLLATNRYYGTMMRIVPASVPCSPLAITGDTTLYVDKVSSSTYSAKVHGWEPDISFKWIITGGGTVKSDLSKATINWTEKVNAVRSLSVKAVNDCGESVPTTLLVTTKVIVTALDPLAVSYVKVYPNPAQTRVMIEHVGLRSLPIITWYDIGGKPLSLVGNPVTGFDVSRLSAGQYLVRIQTDTYNEVKRVIISR